MSIVLRRSRTKTVKVSELFNYMDVPDRELVSKTPIGDVFIKTPYGVRPIKTLIRTEKQKSVTCYFKNNKTLHCSPHHLVKTQNGWTKVSELTNEHDIETDTGITRIKSIKKKPDQILYDLSVDSVHCYYTNGIVSHNSWLLINIGANAIRNGKNVVHFTLELNENYVGQRYDSVITGIPAQNLKNHQEDIENKMSRISGELVIKYYPTKSVGVMALKAHIEKSAMVGKAPDLVIVDYADLLKVSAKDKHEALEELYEELRGMAGEYGVPVWTATQAGRSALEEDIIEADKIAASYGKVMVSDFIMSLSRKVQDKLSGTGRVHIVKNRFGPDGMTLPSKINTNNGQFQFFEPDTTQGKATKQDMKSGETLMKKSLKEKFKDLGGSLG